MKTIATLASFLTLALAVVAQELPKPSPAACVTQRVGLTDITIDYSRPGVKNREIWGKLVPYDEMWRTGANKATSITLTGTAIINDQMLEAGSYSLFTIPQESGSWEVILNRNTELWGTGNYSEDEDAARFDAEVRELDEMTERLEFRFIDVDMNTAELVLEWAGKQVVMRIESDPMEQVVKNIEKALAESKEGEQWKVYRTSASFAKDANLTAKGIEWIEKSIEMHENWYSHWIYADLLAQKKDYDGAIKQAEKANKLGEKEYAEKEKEFIYGDDLMEEVSNWKNKKNK